MYIYILVLMTVYYVNYKFTKAVRVITYQENESMFETIINHIILIGLSIGWGYFLNINFH